MLLDSLGIKTSVFMELQDGTLEKARRDVSSFELSSRLLRQWGVGAAYDLPILFYNLGLSRINGVREESFVRTILDSLLYHIKREIKYRARIPGKCIAFEQKKPYHARDSSRKLDSGWDC